MTVGLPGAGIGGVFYLLSALSMPVHAVASIARHRLGWQGAGRSPTRWGLIARQVATALGIIAALWITGWALAGLLLAHPTALGEIQSTEVGRRLPNVLRVAAVMVSVGTLLIALAVVQVARLLIAPPSWGRRTLAVAGSLVVIAFLTPAALAQSSSSAPASEVALLIAAADTAFDRADAEAARREYERVLALDPENSRALFRMGQLSSSDPAAAERFFRRYVAAEPGDAWGYLALADLQMRIGRSREALATYDRAMRLAPAEREVRIGRARALAAAGRTDQAIAEYEAWTAQHRDDFEALRELGDQRRRAGRFREASRAYEMSLSRDRSGRTESRLSTARGFSAPAVELQTLGSGDSDQNRTVRAGAAASVQIADRVRAQVSGSRRRISGISEVWIDDASISLFARPLAAFRVEATGGVARPFNERNIVIAPAPAVGLGARTSFAAPPPGKGRRRGTDSVPPVAVPPGTVIQPEPADENLIFVGMLRGVWRQPGGRGSLDLRGTRTLLDATPILVANRVVRTEVGARADVPIAGRFGLRAGGKLGSYDALGEQNRRTSLLGGVTVRATDAVEASGIFQKLTFQHATTSGYFAPAVAHLAELASYAEFENASGVVLALDAGAGAQRYQEFAAGMGGWEPSYRLFASLSVPLRAGSEFRFEVDSYDSRLGSEAATSSSWRFISALAAVRIAFR